MDKQNKELQIIAIWAHKKLKMFKHTTLVKSIIWYEGYQLGAKAGVYRKIQLENMSGDVFQNSKLQIEIQEQIVRNISSSN